MNPRTRLNALVIGAMMAGLSFAQSPGTKIKRSRKGARGRFTHGGRPRLLAAQNNIAGSYPTYMDHDHRVAADLDHRASLKGN